MDLTRSQSDLSPLARYTLDKDFVWTRTPRAIARGQEKPVAIKFASFLWISTAPWISLGLWLSPNMKMVLKVSRLHGECHVHDPIAGCYAVR